MGCLAQIKAREVVKITNMQVGFLYICVRVTKAKLDFPNKIRTLVLCAITYTTPDINANQENSTSVIFGLYENNKND